MSVLIWPLAVLLMIWWQAYTLAVLLSVGFMLNLIEFKRRTYPTAVKWMAVLLHLAWLTAAILTNIPVLAVGMLWQFIGIMLIHRAFAKEASQSYAELERSYEQQTQLLDELRQQRHDLHKHLAALEYGSGESDNAYRKALLKRHSKIDQVLKNENHIVAGALYASLQEAERHQVDLTLSMQHPLSGLPLTRLDLVSLIGNMLTNAIEAAAEYRQKTGNDANVQLSCRKQSGIWILVCQNDSVPLADDILDRLYTSRAKSTKGGNHEGLGTWQIKQIVKSHDGTLDFSLIDNQYTLKIKIPAIQKHILKGVGRK